MEEDEKEGEAVVVGEATVIESDLFPYTGCTLVVGANKGLKKA